MVDSERLEFSEVEVETEMDLAQAVSYLEEIVAGMKSGRLTIENEGQGIILSPQRTVKVAVEAKQKKDKEAVSIKIGWHVPAASKPPAPPLRISSKVNSDDH